MLTRIRPRLNAFAAAMLSAFAAATLATATPVGGPWTVKTFCEAYESAELLHRLGACKGASAADPSVAKDSESVARARHQCVELINSGISQKRQRFDASAAQRCLAAQRSYLADPRRSSALGEAMRDACALVTQGAVAENQPCESALDCQSQLACLGAKGAPPGICTSRLPAGHACDDERLGVSRFYAVATSQRAACDDGLHCSAAGGELKCVADIAPGQSCTGTDPNECGPARRCGLSRCVEATRSGRGEVCIDSRECAAGLYCDSGSCVSTKPAGAACRSESECKGTCRHGRCAAQCSSG